MHAYQFLTTILVISLFAISTQANSTQVDTIQTVELQELLVESQNSYVTEDGIKFIPNKQVKNSSHDAISLLRNMSLPMLIIDPTSGSIKNIANSSVSIYIDYMPSTPQDLQGIRTTDVIRVEYYDNPSDTRFGGAQSVINFILRKYEYGGYVKPLAEQSFFYNTGNYMLYSKLQRKKLTYDVSLGGKYSIDNGYAISSKDNYYFQNNMNENYLIKRDENGNGRNKNQSAYATFRTKYSTDNILISNEIGLNYVKTPYSYLNGDLIYNIADYKSYTFNSNSRFQSLSPYYNGHYFFVLNQKNSLRAIVNFSYSQNKTWSNYNNTLGSMIINNSSENAYYPMASIVFNHKLGHNNSLGAEIHSFNRIYKSKYEGSFSNTQSYFNSENVIISTYRHKIANKLNLYARLGASISASDVNGKKYFRINPRIGAQINYAINNKNNLNFQFWLASSTIDYSLINDVVLQINEIEWKEGNSELYGMPWYMTTLAYTWLASNKFNLSASSYFECYTDKFMPIYRQDNNRMIIKYINQGGWIRLKESVQATYRPIKEIAINGWAMYANYFCYDGNNARISQIFGGASITGYWKHFSLNAYYTSKISDLGYDGKIGSIPHQYGLSISYGNKNWFGKVNFNNIFNNDRYKSTTLSTPIIKSETQNFSDSYGRNISLTLVYIFDFGKKIQHNDELDIPQGINSAIMKAE